MKWPFSANALLRAAVLVAVLVLLGAAQIGVLPPDAFLRKLCVSSSNEHLKLQSNMLPLP